MERKVFLHVLMSFVLLANMPLFGQTIWLQADLANGAHLEAADNPHEFRWTDPNRIIELGGNLTIDPGVQVTFVNVTELRFTNGADFNCGSAQGGAQITIRGFANDPNGGNRNIDNNPVTILLTDSENEENPTSIGTIWNTTFQRFGIAIEAEAGSELNVTSSLFEDCDVCVHDQTDNTQLNACRFDNFWDFAVHAENANGFQYVSCIFQSADQDGDLDGNLLAARHIRCDDCDSDCRIDSSSFDHLTGREGEGVDHRWINTSIELEDSSPSIFNSTFNFEEIENTPPRERIDTSVFIHGDSDPTIKGIHTICDAKIFISVGEGNTVFIDSSFFEFSNNPNLLTLDDHTIEVIHGNVSVTRCCFIDRARNILFQDTDDVNTGDARVGGYIANNLFIRSGRDAEQEFKGVEIVVFATNRLMPMEVSNNLFIKEGDDDPTQGRTQCWYGIQVRLSEQQEYCGQLKIKNNLFTNDGEQWGFQTDVACIYGAGGDFADDYNYLYNFNQEDPDETFVGIDEIGQNNELDGDDPDFVESPFGSITFLQGDDRDYDVFLDFDSPCIDAGDPDNDLRDLNHTHNDMGIYGGSEAEVEMAGLYFGTMDAAATCDVPAEVPANYTLTVEDVVFTVDEEFTVDGTLEVEDGGQLLMDGEMDLDGTGEIILNDNADMVVDDGGYIYGDLTLTGGDESVVSVKGSVIVSDDLQVFTIDNTDDLSFLFDEDCRWSVGGDMDVTGQPDHLVTFANAAGQDDWKGLTFSGNGGHNSSLEYIEVAGSDWDGINIGSTWVSSINHCAIHDNARAGIGITGIFEGTTTITSSEIYDNGQYGFFVDSDGGAETVIIGGDLVGNHVHDNGYYGLFVIDNDFESTDNTYESNGNAGVIVYGDDEAIFDGDTICDNGPSGLGTGMVLYNAAPYLVETIIEENLSIGMGCWGTTFVDMGPGVNPPIDRFNAVRRNGFDVFDDPQANVPEIKIGSSASIVIAFGLNDIFDDRFQVPPIPPADILIVGPMGIGIDGSTNYFGGDLLVANSCFSPPTLIFNWDENLPNVDDFGNEEAANVLLSHVSNNLIDKDYRSAMQTIHTILTEYSETYAAAACPILLLRCVRKLGLNLDENREFLLDLEICRENVPLQLNREIVANMLLLYSGEYEEAIENFTEVMRNAESREDSVAAAMNVAYAERIRDIRQNGFGINGAGSSFEDKVAELAGCLNNETPFGCQQPTEFKLSSVYPNPFNSVATINYSLPEESHIKISIHDLNGREIGLVYEGMRSAGNYSAVWDAGNTASGIYICRINANDHIQSTKMTLLR